MSFARALSSASGSSPSKSTPINPLCDFNSVAFRSLNTPENVMAGRVFFSSSYFSSSPAASATRACLTVVIVPTAGERIDRTRASMSSALLLLVSVALAKMDIRRGSSGAGRDAIQAPPRFAISRRKAPWHPCPSSGHEQMRLKPPSSLRASSVVSGLPCHSMRPAMKSLS